MTFTVKQIATALVLSRAAVKLAVAAVVIVLGMLVVQREYCAVAPHARWPLAANHQLTADDLVSDPVDELKGRYLGREVRAGDPITLAMTTGRRIAPWPGNTLAVILTIPAATPSQPLTIANHMAVDIRDGDKTLASGEVLDLDCGEHTCSVVVGIDKHTDVDTRALQSATLRPAPVPTAQ